MPELPSDLVLTELHVHVGSAVDPAVMWSIAHRQGIRLPTKSYWDFVKMITVPGQQVSSFDHYLRLFNMTELIQSSPVSMEESVYAIIGGAYRRNNIGVLEIRFNPMKRNRGGERDVDHIIAGAARGMERAVMEYPVKAGLILCLDKSFSLELNTVIVRKALQHLHHGVVGIDMAGPEKADFSFRRYRDLMHMAREGGLGITLHAGESGTPEAMQEAVEVLEPDRIGHGVKAVHRRELLQLLHDREILLEICPTSNLATGVVRDHDEFRNVLQTFQDHGVRFCFNTDGPEMLCVHLRDEINGLIEGGLITVEQAVECNRWATDSTFLKL
jgi:adenosine deaminase